MIRGSTPVDDFIPLLGRAQFTVNEEVVGGVSAPGGLIAAFSVFKELINCGLMAYAPQAKPGTLRTDRRAGSPTEPPCRPAEIE